MKIIIAEDHALFREALKSLILSIEPAAQIIETSTYKQTQDKITQMLAVDYVILDLALPDEHWERGLKQLLIQNAHIKIIVISAYEDILIMRRVCDYGVVGYIPKSVDSKILSSALRLILAGGTYMPIQVASARHDEIFAPHNNSNGLTRRQNEVLHLVAEGKSNKQIAYEMGVSEATVKLHINALLRSLGVTNRTQAVITAQRNGFI